RIRTTPARSTCAGRGGSTDGAQEVQVTLVVVENVVDHILALPAGDVVVLTAFAQVHFGAEVLHLRLPVAARVAQYESRRLVSTRSHRIEEVDGIAVHDLDPDAAVLAAADARVELLA